MVRVLISRFRNPPVVTHEVLCTLCAFNVSLETDTNPTSIAMFYRVLFVAVRDGPPALYTAGLVLL